MWGNASFVLVMVWMRTCLPGEFSRLLGRQEGDASLQPVLELPEGTIDEFEGLGETWVDREYVYGPDYVNEFILQVDRDVQSHRHMQASEARFAGVPARRARLNPRHADPPTCQPTVRPLAADAEKLTPDKID